MAFRCAADTDTDQAFSKQEFLDGFNFRDMSSTPVMCCNPNGPREREWSFVKEYWGGLKYHDDAAFRHLYGWMESNSYYFATPTNSYSGSVCTSNMAGFYVYLSQPEALAWTDYTVEFAVWTHVRDKGVCL